MPDRDRDFKPEEGQRSNQNWDEQNDQSSSKETNPNAESEDRRTNTSGTSSNQPKKEVKPGSRPSTNPNELPDE